MTVVFSYINVQRLEDSREIVLNNLKLSRINKNDGANCVIRSLRKVIVL